MIITFLGTGTSQGVPVIGCECEVCTSIDYRDKRLRSSVFIQSDDLNIIIDTGPDFRQQVLRERIKRLDAILYTHEHKDHIAGMDDIRSFNYRQNMDMPIYARKNVLEQLKKEYAYVFSETKYPGIPQVQLKDIHSDSFYINSLKITPIEVMHLKLPVLGFRFGDFTYITDANFISEEAIEKIKGSRILVINALQKAEHISHFNLDQAIEIAKMVKAEKTFFTHISHLMGLHRKTSLELPEGVFLGYDGLKISLN